MSGQQENTGGRQLSRKMKVVLVSGSGFREQQHGRGAVATAIRMPIE